MQTTKHDLSAGEVKLDYQALLTTAQYAVGRLISAIEQEKAELHDALFNKEWTKAYLRANYLVGHAKALAVAMETLSALSEGLDREDKIIVNVLDEEKMKKEGMKLMYQHSKDALENWKGEAYQEDDEVGMAIKDLYTIIDEVIK